MKIWIAAAIAVIAVFAGIYYAHRPAGDSPAEPAAVRASDKAAAPTAPPPQTQLTSRSKVDDAARPASSDPRVAALLVAPDDERVEFVIGENGKVIAEIGQDPGSPGYRKPLREYSYAGDRVAIVTTYRYKDAQVHVTRTMVFYKPDGTVDRIREPREDRPTTR